MRTLRGDYYHSTTTNERERQSPRRWVECEWWVDWSVCDAIRIIVEFGGIVARSIEINTDIYRWIDQIVVD